MPMVDPWRGTNQGLAALGKTFDELNARRRQEIQDTLAMERDRRDAEKDALAIESGRMTLDEQKRKVDNLRAYDEARKAQVAGFDTATVPAEVPNPDYRPPVPEGLNSTLTYAGEANEVTPAQPAQGLPTMAGSRPMNENEKLAAMAQLAFKHGDTETLSKIGQWVNITDKLKGSEYDRMNKALDAIEKAAIMGPQYQLSVAKQVTKELGAPQNVIDQMVVNPNMNGIATPIADAEGKVIGNMIFTWKNGKRQDLFHALPVDKTFKEGDTREIKVGDTLQTQEYRNGKWEKLSTAPRYKPEGATVLKEKEFQYQDRMAKESLSEKGNKNPTIAQIAQERARLYPKGSTKAPGRDPRSELKGGNETKMLNGKKYTKINGIWYVE